MSSTTNDRRRASKLLAPRFKGKFCAFKPSTEATRCKALKREVSSARKERRKNEIFDKFVCLFFLKGDETDWLPTSARSGPLVSLVRAIFKKSYILDESSRREKLIRAYFGGDSRKIKTITTRTETRDASLDKGSKSRPVVFRERRLPRIENDSAEVQPVKQWLEELNRCGALKDNSVESVLGSVIDLIKSNVWVGKRRAYVGYPKPRNSKNTAAENNVDVIDLVPRNTLSSAMEVFPAAAEITGVSDAPQSEAAGTPTSSSGAEQEDESMTGENHMRVFVECARNDHTYAMFCAIFDKELEHQFDLASGLFLLNKRDKESRIVPYLTEIILYLHWKNTGIIDPLAHKQREIKLKHVADFLTNLREVYGMKTYSEIRWMFT